MRILCVVGARPNFMKAAPVVTALAAAGAEVRLVHTGQHYDHRMSGLFFDELGLPRPDLDLQVGSGSHGEQTGQIMTRLDPILREAPPDRVVVFGDVNSTVAASLCAAKMGIEVAHVEAGLRSFDRTMPEELNRIVTDHLSDYLFTTEPSGRANLLREGIPETRIHFVGNVMVDTLLHHLERARRLRVWEEYGWEAGRYAVLTLHRPSNVDDRGRLAAILGAVSELSWEMPILFPCHVRTRRRLDEIGQARPPGPLRIVEPLGYLECLSILAGARLVLTDSGGIQEETTVLGVPCLTLRENTERPVTIEQGTNVLVGTSRERILQEARKVLEEGGRAVRLPELWDGRAAERIAATLLRGGAAEAPSAGGPVGATRGPVPRHAPHGVPDGIDR